MLHLFNPMFNTCNAVWFPCSLHLGKNIFMCTFYWFCNCLKVLQVFVITGPSPAEQVPSPVCSIGVVRSVARSLALKNTIYFKYIGFISPQMEGDVRERWMGKNTKGTLCALTKWLSWYLPEKTAETHKKVTSCGQWIVIYLCNKDQPDALFSLNLFQ